VALRRGSLALFAVKPTTATITRANLLNARQLSSGSLDWETTTEGGKLAFRPFEAIGEEQYRLYQEVIG